MGGVPLKIQIDTILLEGASRRVDFTEGLNIITGPIACGKTTLYRLIKAVIGGSLDNLPPEARESINSIASNFHIGSKSYSILRPAVTTRNSLIEIAGEEEILRIPFSQTSEEHNETYLHWLLLKLNLPRLEVPSAPTKPESEPTPISINDYLLYCAISQEDIGFSVFGHSDPFKNIKRKYVFEIIYGIYSIETASIQENLRDVQTQLRELRNQESLFNKFIADTALQSKIEIINRLEKEKQQLVNLEKQISEIKQKAINTPTKEKSQKALIEIEKNIYEIKREVESERTSIKNLERLASQLETQSGRITRSIVAHTHLSDIDFIVCPRCGSEVSHSRTDNENCYLCLQKPESQVSRQALIDEQNNLGA